MLHFIFFKFIFLFFKFSNADSGWRRGAFYRRVGGWSIILILLFHRWFFLYVSNIKAMTLSTKRTFYMTSTTRFRSLIVIPIKLQPQLHLTSVYWTSSSTILVYYTWTSMRHVNTLVVFVRITKPISVRAAEQQDRVKMHNLWLFSDVASCAGPKLCVLEKNLALGR